MLEHVETKTNTYIQRMQWYNYMNPKRLVNGLRGDQTTLKISYEPCCEKTGLQVSDQVRHKTGCTVTEVGL